MAPVDSEWSFNMRSHQCLSDSDSDTSPPHSPSSAMLSDDTRQFLDLDLSSREDSAVYKPNPWSIAKVNAASRPAPAPAQPKPATTRCDKQRKQPTGIIADMLRKQAQQPSAPEGTGLKPGVPPPRHLSQNNRSIKGAPNEARRARPPSTSNQNKGKTAPPSGLPAPSRSTQAQSFQLASSQARLAAPCARNDADRGLAVSSSNAPTSSMTGLHSAGDRLPDCLDLKPDVGTSTDEHKANTHILTYNVHITNQPSVFCG
ncbi:hypothetical protein FA95DRAFT_1574231 [Auriscalpium vulgare]|uniref:Uncharacterized protein n=1 Tax=Auriscalpium vulgare TaxID=40419 RepID=A0ACB8RMB2_9AGAM|nr:hypothetical protein FA95DRAFT_1574231 [Auriscalpium vulgare]